MGTRTTLTTRDVVHMWRKVWPELRSGHLSWVDAYGSPSEPILTVMTVTRVEANVECLVRTRVLAKLDQILGRVMARLNAAWTAAGLWGCSCTSYGSSAMDIRCEVHREALQLILGGTALKEWEKEYLREFFKYYLSQ